jgi:hypothetical protein
MTMDEQRKRLPPYVSYRTFSNFISGLQQNMPSRIDRSYWGEFLSGSTGTQLMAALRFLGLIDTNGRPTTLLRSLVSASIEQKAGILREIASESYSFVLQSSLLEPNNATYAQLEEAFKGTFKLADDVGRKCIKFFIAMAQDSGIPLSPFITKRFRSAHAGSGTKTATRKASTRTVRNLEVPKEEVEIPNRALWNKMLLEKFPTFDPTWSDEIKQKWFVAFDELLKLSFLDGKK